jgi:eukaryotic-like serine/threonine-protein kinase
MSWSLNAEVLAARYRLDSPIASGGMGEVWRGVDLVLDRQVAVKVLHAEYARQADTIARFRAEARHTASLSHPAIAQVYDFGEGSPPGMSGSSTDGPAFLVMELVDGPPLTQILARGPLEPATVLDVVAQVASGLAVAHAAGVVHRDIKPGNLLVDHNGMIKITDFGVAYALGSAPLTRTGTLIGTPGYLAPERVSGHAAGPASDLYSLGIVAYECLTGSLPFSGTAMEIALAHQMGSLPPLPARVPREVADLIADLTARDPAQRPASAGLVAARAQALRTAFGGLRPRASLGGSGADLADGNSIASPPGSPRSHRTEILPLADVAGMGTDDGYGPFQPVPPGQGRPRPSPLRRAALGAAAIAVVAGLAVWALTRASGAASPTGQSSSPPAHSSTPAASGVPVNAAALVGQPVWRVVRQLDQLGLVVHVRWESSYQQQQGGQQQQPGTVVSVQPAGNLAPGTIVYVTGAGGHDHGHGHGRGNGGQGGNGD